MVFPFRAGARSPRHHDPPLAHLVLQCRHGDQSRFGTRLGRERRRRQAVLQHHHIAAGAPSATDHTRNGQLTSRFFRSFLHTHLLESLPSRSKCIQCGHKFYRALRGCVPSDFLTFREPFSRLKICVPHAEVPAAHPRWRAVNPSNEQRQQTSSPSFPAQCIKRDAGLFANLTRAPAVLRRTRRSYLSAALLIEVLRSLAGAPSLI